MESSDAVDASPEALLMLFVHTRQLRLQQCLFMTINDIDSILHTHTHPQKQTGACLVQQCLRIVLSVRLIGSLCAVLGTAPDLMCALTASTI